MVVILDTLETVWRLKKTKKDIGYRKIFDLYFHLKIDCLKDICYDCIAIFLMLKLFYLSSCDLEKSTFPNIAYPSANSG